jgi:uncharacterized protein YacL
MDDRIKLIAIRALLIVVSAGVGLLLSSSFGRPEDSIWYMLGAVAVAGVLIIAEMFFSKSDISTVSAIVFGLIIGLIMAYLFQAVLLLMVEDEKLVQELKTPLHLILTVIFCYFGVTFLLRTRNNFRFIIPYVEFRRELRGKTPFFLDTSALIDGRIREILETKVIESEILVPKFVVDELHTLSDSKDRIKRSRGKRGLDILNELRRSKIVEARILEEDVPEAQQVDAKLVSLAASKGGKIVTTDSNLDRLAQLRNVTVVNLHKLANALRQVLTVGEDFKVKLVKPGENPGQGVGYLVDGTMVVIDAGKEFIGQEITATVTSTHQTSAGRMIFGKVKSSGEQIV